MLAGRLIRAARDILGEYSRFKIIDRLTLAASVSAQRTGGQNNAYTEQARQLRQWAQSVIDQSLIDKYPEDLRIFLDNSNYAAALPASIARVVLAGFPDDIRLGMSSSEVGLYAQLATILRSELSSLDAIANKLNIEQVSIPVDQVCLDIMIPRIIFADRIDNFIVILRRFIKIISYIIELTTGSESSPTLTYGSTSDPVTGVALVGAAAWGVLKFYKLMLEVAEKQFSLLKTLREFRSVAPDASSDVEERVQGIVGEALKQAVEGAVTSVPASVPDERVNEIKNALNIEARFTVNDIANGVRISITAESIDRITYNRFDTWANPRDGHRAARRTTGIGAKSPSIYCCLRTPRSRLTFRRNCSRRSSIVALF
jgi:hypothetical protein